ncbi:MAG: NAD(+) diphosphatase [Pseudolysinimonas sp.]
MSRAFHTRLPLSRSQIDRDHLGRARGVEAVLADPEARAVVLHEGRALLSGPDALAIVPAVSVTAQDALYLGRSLTGADDLPEGAPVLALLVDDAQAAELTGPAPAEDAWGDLRRLGHRLSERDAGLFTQALALANWHRAYGFSPRSGVPTTVASAGWTRVDSDGKEVYPRTDAAVIVGVIDADDRLLLGSNAMWEANRFSLLAGFVEPGESLEAAVIREVFEESGVVVEEPEYLGSQPWPFPASLMVGFRARVAAGQSTEGTPDGEEILALRWFTREQLRDAIGSREVILPGPTSIARAIIEDWYGDDIDDGARA